MFDSSKKETFEPDEKFWETWRGHVVRAIVLNSAYTKEAILKSTNLTEEQFEKAVKELSETNLLGDTEDRKFWVDRELYRKCQKFFEGLQETLVDWVKEWREKQRVDLFKSEEDHFYLSGKMLSELSESLIEHARQNILVVNPFVRRCHISGSLISMSRRGVQVKLLTRGIGTEQFKKEISKKVFISYDESVHAKIIVVDRRVGVVSSMNFYAGSSAGECWEAGVISTDRHVVNSIERSIQEKIASLPTK